MDDAEVGHFVKRLRNLMDEIGKLLSQLGNVSQTACPETFRNAAGGEGPQQFIHLGVASQMAPVYA